MNSVGLGIEVRGLLRQVGRVDVGDEQGPDAGIRVRLESFVDHHRAEVRPADADVHDVCHLLAGDAAPLARTHTIREHRHRAEHFVDVVVDVLPVDDERGRGARGAAQRGVEHRAVLGGTDVLAGEHGGVVLGDAGLLGEGDQRGEDLVGDEVLRQVDVQVAERKAEALDPAGAPGEPRPQIGGEGVAVGRGAQPRRPWTWGRSERSRSPR